MKVQNMPGCTIKLNLDPCLNHILLVAVTDRGATAKWSKISFIWIPLKIAEIVDIGLISREKKFREKKIGW